MRSNTPPRANGARTLVLLRHGQSNANAENSFSGWLDVPLTERGEAEAARAAELLSRGGSARWTSRSRSWTGGGSGPTQLAAQTNGATAAKTAVS